MEYLPYYKKHGDDLDDELDETEKAEEAHRNEKSKEHRLKIGDGAASFRRRRGSTERSRASRLRYRSGERTGYSASRELASCFRPRFKHVLI